MIISLEARNYRRLNRTVWSPTGVCALVGPNGAGKTTLLTALEFLHNAFVRGAASALDPVGGVYGLRSWGTDDDDPVMLAFTFGQLRWELQLTAKGPTLSEQLGERVTLGSETILSRVVLSQRVVYRDKEHAAAAGDERVGLRIVNDAESPDELVPLVNAIKAIRVYRSYNLWSLQRNGSRHGNDLYLHPSGQNAFTVLRNWRDRRELRKQHDFVVNGLRSAFPDIFTDLDFHVAGLTITADLIDASSKEVCPLALAPDGLLTGLLHLTAIAGAQPDSFIAIDDFGNDLHPYAIRDLTNSIREWGDEQNLTVCLASHSPVLLDEFNESPHDIFVMEHDLDSRSVPLTKLCDEDWLGAFFSRTASTCTESLEVKGAATLETSRRRRKTKANNYGRRCVDHDRKAGAQRFGKRFEEALSKRQFRVAAN